MLLLAGVNDLEDVRSAVANPAVGWKTFGISLGIPSTALDSICLGSPAECLTQMLTLWLSQCYPVRTSFRLRPICLIYCTKYTILWITGSMLETMAMIDFSI